MKYTLTPKQRKFLEKVIHDFENDRLGTMTVPRTRITNILNNGYYYSDRTSYENPPILINNKSLKSNDKTKLNHLADKMKSYWAK